MTNEFPQYDIARVGVLMIILGVISIATGLIDVFTPPADVGGPVALPGGATFEQLLPDGQRLVVLGIVPLIAGLFCLFVPEPQVVQRRCEDVAQARTALLRALIRFPGASRGSLRERAIDALVRDGWGRARARYFVEDVDEVVLGSCLRLADQAADAGRAAPSALRCRVIEERIAEDLDALLGPTEFGAPLHTALRERAMKAAA